MRKDEGSVKLLLIACGALLFGGVLFAQLNSNDVRWSDYVSKTECDLGAPAEATNSYWQTPQVLFTEVGLNKNRASKAGSGVISGDYYWASKDKRTEAEKAAEEKGVRTLETCSESVVNGGEDCVLEQYEDGTRNADGSRSVKFNFYHGGSSFAPPKRTEHGMAEKKHAVVHRWLKWDNRLHACLKRDHATPCQDDQETSVPEPTLGDFCTACDVVRINCAVEGDCQTGYELVSNEWTTSTLKDTSDEPVGPADGVTRCYDHPVTGYPYAAAGCGCPIDGGGSASCTTWLPLNAE